VVCFKIPLHIGLMELLVRLIENLWQVQHATEMQNTLQDRVDGTTNLVHTYPFICEHLLGTIKDFRRNTLECLR
jgi:hypothetical protein